MRGTFWILSGTVLLLIGLLSHQEYRRLLKKIPLATQSFGKKWGAATDRHVILRSMNSFFYVIGMAVTLTGFVLAANSMVRHTDLGDSAPFISQNDDNLSAGEVFRLVNSERKAQNLKELIEDTRLTAIAQERLDDMANNQYYAHLNPEGKYYYDLFPKHQIKAGYSCENLDVEFTTDEKVYVNDWLTSTKGHKECMLNKDVTSAGYAVGLFSQPGETEIYLVVGIHSTSISKIPGTPGSSP